MTMKKIYILIALILVSTTSLFPKDFICNTEKPYVREMTIDSSNKDSLPSTLESNCFYKMDFTSDTEKSSLCKVDVYNERGKIARTDMIIANENNHFISKIYVPYGATKMTLSLKNDKTSDFEQFKSFELIPFTMDETPILSKDEKTDIVKITIDHTNLYAVPKTLEPSTIYLFDVNLEEFDYDKYTLVPRIQNADIYKNLMVRQKNGHFVGTILASENTISISLESANVALGKLDTLFYSKVENIDSINKNKTRLAIGKDLKKADLYRKNTPDKRLISFLESKNVRNICKTNPDEALDLCINKISELSSDDFEKVFLIHDAIWYLVSYDYSSYKKMDPLNQDYYSNLKRGVCVCEGFSKLFSQMCFLMNIPTCDVYGWAVLQNIGGQEAGGLHAWNIVMVENNWYTIDVTWDCSHFINGKRDDFYSTNNIFQKPKYFVKSHHPSSPEFQLLNKPLEFGYVENVVP